MKAIIKAVFVVTIAGTALFPGTVRSGDFLVYLRLDKEKYYENEDIVLKMCIRNRSVGIISFTVFEDNRRDLPDYTTFQPVVFDNFGREAEIIIPYRMKNLKAEQVVKRMKKRIIELAPGEEFIHSVNLRNVYDLIPEKKYRVRGYFFKNFSENSIIKSNNVLYFRTAGRKKEPPRYLAKRYIHEVSPSEVVTLALNAERDKDPERMIKYFKVEKYINSYSDFVRKYNIADNIERKIIINDFIKFLSRERDDYILNYRILKDEIESSGKIAYVDVIVERYFPKRPYRYLYRYTLEKYKNLWLIIDLEATVKKIRGLRQ